MNMEMLLKDQYFLMKGDLFEYLLFEKILEYYENKVKEKKEMKAEKKEEENKS